MPELKAKSDGCWVTRMLLQNLLTYATRSRRKGPDGAGLGKDAPKAKGDAKAESWDEGRPGLGLSRVSPSGDFSVCELISDAEFGRLVAPPPGLDTHEWLATHAVGLFHHVNALYGAVAESCSPESCPTMSTPTTSQAMWVDEKGKKWKYNAPQYVDAVMTQTQALLDNEELFPTKFGTSFPTSLEPQVRRLTRLLAAVLGHAALAHAQHLDALGLNSQVSAVASHLAAFGSTFSMLEPKELEALTALAARPRPKRTASRDEVPSVDSTVPPETTLLLRTGPACELAGPSGSAEGSWSSSTGGPETFGLACAANA